MIVQATYCTYILILLRISSTLQNQPPTQKKEGSILDKNQKHATSGFFFNFEVIHIKVSLLPLLLPAFKHTVFHNGK
jgi:hypothetical protein